MALERADRKHWLLLSLGCSAKYRVTTAFMAVTIASHDLSAFRSVELDNEQLHTQSIFLQSVRKFGAATVPRVNPLNDTASAGFGYELW